MKILSLFLFVFFSFSLFAETIPGGWLTDVARAKRRSAEEKKPILLIISGPSSDEESKNLKKDVIDNDDFDKAVKKNAVCLIAYTQPNKKQNKKDLALRKTFAGIYKGKVPCYAVLDSKLKVLAIPAGKTAYDFVKAISDVLVKNGGKPIKELKDLEKDYNKELNKKEKKSKKSSRKNK